MKKNSFKKLCVSAVLAALFVALELLAANIGNIVFLGNYQIPISCFPLILASIMFGTTWGTAVGLIGSFLSQLYYGLSWSTLVWMLPTICYSYIVAFLFLLFKKSYHPFVLGIEFLLSSLVLSALNLLAMFIDINILAVNYGFSFGGSDLINSFLGVFLSVKLIGALIFSIIFAIIVPPIVKRMKKIIKY